MKNLIFTTAVVLGFSTVKANHLNSELNLKMYDNSPFTITFDNITYNSPAGTFVIGNVIPGNHYMKVSKTMYRHYGPIGMQKIVFCGNVNIPVNSKVFSLIDFYSNYNVMSVLPNYAEPVCDKGKGWDNNDEWGRGGCEGERNDEYGYDKDCEKGGGWMKPCGMNPYDFCNLKNSITGKAFESSRMAVAKQAIASNYMSSAQITELVELMTFETSKLDLAKFAYRFTIDKNNYYLVNDAFSFESSIRELAGYISRIG
jgi:hypothetical protein